MKNFYKHMLVVSMISLGCPITHLNADLLNGPYSPESQELVKLAQNPDMAIPEKFKNLNKEIASLRKQFDPNSEMGPYGITSQAQPYVEAYAQLLLLKKPQAKYPTAYPSREYYKHLFANIALQLNDINLLNSILKDTSQDLKNYLLFETLKDAILRSNVDKNDLEKLKSVNPQYDLEQQWELDKVEIKALIDNGAQINSKIKDPNSTILNEPLIADRLPTNFDFLVFLINIGFNINAIFNEDSMHPSKQSLIDRYMFLITPNSFYYQIYKDKIPAVQKIIDFLKSKGAKTYAELTEKNGQK